MAQSQTTRSEVLRLSFANAVEAGLRLVVPIVLVRLISPGEFGQYRLFWLIANSLTLFLPLGMVRSLLFFLPRSDADERAAFVRQTVYYLVVVSLPFAVLLAFGGHWLPESIQSLTERDLVLGAFTFLWVVSSLVLTLPNADGNIAWQSGAIIGLALLRAALILTTAWITRDLEAIFLALLLFAIAQALLLGYYMGTRYGQRWRLPGKSQFVRQVGYAVPFGLSGVLARARGQIEQWLVVGLFLPESLAMLAIAGSFTAILRLLRKSVGSILIPRMSSTHASGDVLRALELNNRGNLVICFMIFPAVVFIWLFAAPLVELLFTGDYLDAVPVIRVYTIGMIFMSVELATVLMIYEQGRFVAKVSAGVLLVSAVFSYLGAIYFGLPGVALGGVVGTLITRVLNFRRAASVLGVRMRYLQDWPTLIRILAGSIAAGVVTRAIASQLPPGLGVFLYLVAVATVFAVLLPCFAWLLRTHWIAHCMLGRSAWPDSRPF